MPRLSVWMLRTALLALLAGTALGALLLATEPRYDSVRGALRETHLTLLLFGWLVQFVLGVAYWMLPRYTRAPDRGPPWAGWAAYGAFIGGLGLASFGALLTVDGLAPAGRLLLAGATFAFILLLWGRAKPFGTRLE
jgi:heme/copper-type cytochrome/quinol oxidase subunit 1